MTVRPLPVIERLEHASLTAIAREWDQLLAESGVTTPFMTWAWVGAWLDTMGRDADLEVHVARDADDGRLLGIAPFQVVTSRRSGLPIRELRMVPAGATVLDHLDLIVHRDGGSRVADALWAEVTRVERWDLVDLDGIVAGGHLDRLALRRVGDVAERIPVQYLSLAAGSEAVVARLSRSHHRGVEHPARKPDVEPGSPVIERMVAEHSDLDATLDRLIELQQRSRTSEGGPKPFADDTTTRFLRTAAHRLLDSGRLRMWRLDVAGEAIAVIWCMRAFDSVALYASGFDAGWGAYGRGRRILARAIQSSAAEGATVFDFLCDDGTMRAWGTETRYALRIRRPASTRGRVVWAARSVVGRISRGLPDAS